MQSTTPDSSPRPRSLRENIQRLVVTAITSAIVSLITVSFLLAAILAMTTTPYERQASYENGRLSGSIWPVKAWDWSIDRVADFLQAHWLSLVVGSILLIGWSVFAYIRWGSFLPKRQAG